MDRIFKNMRLLFLISFFSNAVIQIIIIIGSLVVKTILSFSYISFFNLIEYCLILLALYFIWFIFDFMNRYFEEKQYWEIRHTLYSHILAGEFESVVDYSFGEYSNLINKEIHFSIQKYSSTLPKIIISIIFGIINLIIICRFNFEIMVFVVVTSFLYTILPMNSKKRFSINYETILSIEKRLTDFFIENIINHSLFLFYGNRWKEKKLSELIDEYNINGVKSELYAQINNAINGFLNYLLKFGTIFFGIIMIGLDKLTFPAMMSIIVIAGNYYSLIDTISKKIVILGKQNISVQNLVSKFSNNLENREMLYDGNKIRINNLSIKFKDRYVFRNFSLEINLNDKIFIHGNNGSGKSTLLRIITGEISDFNGQLIYPSLFKEESLNRFISYVPQRIPVFDISGEKLISVYRNNSSFDENRFFEIYALLGGNEDKLKDNIQAYSDGEMKKLFISLELSKKSRLIVLDEPNNYLDASAVSVLYNILKNDIRGAIIVAHDFSCTQICNKVVYLEDE